MAGPMTKATVTKPFAGLPDGDTKVRDFAVGDEVEGDLAEVAIREGWADEVGAEPAKGTKSKGKAPENKGA